MPARIKLEGKVFGNYHVLEYTGEYDYKNRGAFYKCVDMETGKIHLIRSDHLAPIQKNYEKTLKKIEKIEAYKKAHKLK